ncbi:MAG: uroporphyrinogen decarboxylase family protein [Planctomycetota bacterium]|jgi:uroporphyrinogen decarboxylase
MSEQLNVPLRSPSPDSGRFIRAITTDFQPARPPLIEYIVDRAVMEPVLRMIGREWVDPGPDRGSREAWCGNFIAFWHHMGYDFVRLEIGLGWTFPVRPGGSRGRQYAETATGPITTQAEFEAYPWPDPGAVDFFCYDYIVDRLPEGMGLIANHAGGPLEILTRLMGYETLCLSLFDQPGLVRAVADRVGRLMERFYQRILQLPKLIAIFPGDDMGFRSATLIGPEDLRRYTLPWHKRFAEMAHEAGLPYFLHSCGCLDEIMDDLIDGVGIDAKHSFEDAITSAGEAKRRWGGRIGILGGVDVDKLTRLAPAELRRYVRGVIDECAPGGRFAMGSGNSIPDYIPAANYLTMIDEALR